MYIYIVICFAIFINEKGFNIGDRVYIDLSKLMV